MADDRESESSCDPARPGGPTPKKPKRLNLLAKRILEGLSGRSEAAEIILGGYLALQHYCDHRQTHDIDAWWRGRASAIAETAIRDVMKHTADVDGDELRERRFGETFSFELCREGKRHFSFQIAVRSVELEPPLVSPWPPIWIETLSDNIGSKMNALVERGAPRDFVDIKHVVTGNLSTVAQCWELWRRKNSDQRVDSAKEKVLYHLTSLDMRRPLASIPDSGERARAERTRDWFRREFLGRQA